MRKHGGIRVDLVLGKIREMMLLAVGTIAMLIPGGTVALSQSAPRAQAPLFTAIDLHPRGFKGSEALGVSSGQQVGAGSEKGDYDHALVWSGSAASAVDLIPSGGVKATATCGGQQVGWGNGFGATGRETHALLWRGSVASMVDLHPRGFDVSEALGTSGLEQVGFGIPPTGGAHALLWRGGAASVVDLHPRGFATSEAHGANTGQQVGWGYPPGPSGRHALLWRGSAASVVDLHPSGFYDSWADGTYGGQQVGGGSPIGSHNNHALLWRGSAASVVDLNPRGFLISDALGTNGEEQVGIGNGHALLWHGSATSVVDLHAFLPPGFESSGAMSIDAAGDIVGWASTGHFVPSHAILWKRNVPKPSPSREQNSMRC